MKIHNKFRFFIQRAYSARLSGACSPGGCAPERNMVKYPGGPLGKARRHFAQSKARAEKKENRMNDRQAPSVVCLGFFDGVHRGHLALIRAGKEIAAANGLPLRAHTFDAMPGLKGPPLTDLAERKALLLAAGADEVAVSPFDERMRRMPGDEFFRRVVLSQLNARYVVCGDDHRFGYKGAWGVKDLEALCRGAGIGLTVVPQVTLENGLRISSSAIRAALQAGDFSLAEAMLGRPVPPEMKKSFLL